ncbi:hypothetical protein G6F63_015346 [Rhizopus arrhizus]|nr:hypothetical protein G6F63_015346 [Rhizopus arrhizus]
MGDTLPAIQLSPDVRITVLSGPGSAKPALRSPCPCVYPSHRERAAKRRHPARRNRSVTSAGSDPALIHQFPLHIAVEHRRGHQPRQAERRLHHQHGQQQFPGERLDLAADDARVEEIFQLVDDDQGQQRRHRPGERHRQRDDAARRRR